MTRWTAAALFVLGCSKGHAPSAAHAWLVVESPPASAVDLSTAHVDGTGVRSATFSGSRLVVDLDPSRATGAVVVRTEGGCPLTVVTSALGSGTTTRHTIEPLFDFGPAPAQVGYDAPFEIRATPRCPEAAALRPAWHATSGAPLRETRVSPDGRTFSARTVSFDDALGRPAPWGVVPISPRTRGETDVEFSFEDGDRRQHTRMIRVSAAARARGLPNVALGTRLYLGGRDFHVVLAPNGAKASVEMSGGHATLAPDARGKWTLADADGRLLRLVAGKYDETPLDCGRSDCHAALSDVARTSPMATVFERGLDARFGGDYPACAFGCHTLGEPGIDDGGFEGVLDDLGRTPNDLARTGFHDLPPQLRRLGGVGCLGCHGPGAIPEESARYAVLAADVCATCHDAPPRYGHVVAWRTSRMARADADVQASSTAECARCHTTWGFLGRPERRPRAGTEPLGIGCAACHAVHPTSSEHGVSAGATCAAALLRDAPVPERLAKGFDARADRSKICLGCHTPEPNDKGPSATAGALWAGRGGVDPATGAPLEGAAPHTAVGGGCIGCHRSGPPELERGAGHAFRTASKECTPCHAPGRSDRSIRSRAEALWKSLESGGVPPRIPIPLHAAGRALDLGTARGRASWNVALVLEDPAADAHNAPYARRLLDSAEKVLGAATGGSP